MFRLHFSGVGLPILPQVIEGENRGWSGEVVLNMSKEREWKGIILECPNDCRWRDIKCEDCIARSEFEAVE